jgi:hypothetical protein
MPKTTKKPLPVPHVPLPFTTFVKGLLQVDPKKLPGKGKLTTKAAKRKGKSNRNDEAN